MPNWTRVIIFKLWFPFLISAGTFAVFSTGKHRVATSLPFLLLALLYLSAAQIRIEHNGVRYRRIWHWKRVPYERIVKVRVSFLPGLGFLKFTDILLPWGKLYYVLEEPSKLLLPGSQSEIMKEIESKSNHGPTDNLPKVQD